MSRLPHIILASAEADAFALMMLVVIFFSLGMVAFLLWLMKVKAAQRDPHVDALLDELAETSEAQKNPHIDKTEQNPSMPWEKNADWWKSPPEPPAQ